MASVYLETMTSRRYRPFWMGHLSKDLITRAEKELGETDEIREDAIVALRKMILADTKLKCSTSDEYLLQFLRVCKFHVKSAFSRLQKFYKMKKSYPEIYDDVQISAIETFMKTGAASCLPYRCEDGTTVIVINICRWDPDRFQFPSIALALTVTALFAISDPATQVTGVQVLVDTKNATIKQLKLAVWYTRLVAIGVNKGLPIRFKGIHIVNESVFFRHFWGILRIFLSEKIRNRVHFHGDNFDQLQKYIPKDILPTEYGGENDIHDSAVWFPEELKRFHTSIIELSHFGYVD